jgi:hypothetical protein
MPKQALDYSLYLVTGRELLPSGKVRCSSSCELTSRTTTSHWKRCAIHHRGYTDTKSLKGGVTLVQVREKEVDTGEVCLDQGMPLIPVYRGSQKDQGDLRQGRSVKESTTLTCSTTFHSSSMTGLMSTSRSVRDYTNAIIDGRLGGHPHWSIRYSPHSSP